MAAATPASEVDICNLGLSYLKERPITNLTSISNPAAVACAKWYAPTRRAVLKKAIWNFAKKRALLAASSTAPLFGWDYAFPLPNDFIRLCTVNDQTENTEVNFDYDIEDGNILFNGDADTALPIVYIFDQTNVAKFDSLFVQVLAIELAIAMAFDIIGSEAPIKRLGEILKQVAPEAYAIIGQEKRPVRIQRSKWIARRRGASNSGIAGSKFLLD